MNVSPGFIKTFSAGHLARLGWAAVWIALLLLQTGCAGSLLARPVPPPAPTQAANLAVLDGQVYKAVIQYDHLRPGDSPLLLREPRPGKDGLPLVQAHDLKVLTRILQVNLADDMRPDTLISFRDRNQSATVTAQDFPPDLPIVSFDDGDLEMLSGEDQNWPDVLHQRYPTAPGLVVFSFIGYNAAFDQALVYVARPVSTLAEEGDYVLLQKRDDWQVLKTLTVWSD